METGLMIDETGTRFVVLTFKEPEADPVIVTFTVPLFEKYANAPSNSLPKRQPTKQIGIRPANSVAAFGRPCPTCREPLVLPRAEHWYRDLATKGAACMRKGLLRQQALSWETCTCRYNDRSMCYGPIRCRSSAIPTASYVYSSR